MSLLTVVKSKAFQTVTVLSLAMVSSASFAADTTKTPAIGDYINAETVAPITDSILTVAGIAIAAGFTIMGVVVAAKAGMGLIKGFMSRAAG